MKYLHNSEHDLEDINCGILSNLLDSVHQAYPPSHPALVFHSCWGDAYVIWRWWI